MLWVNDRGGFISRLINRGDGFAIKDVGKSETEGTTKYGWEAAELELFTVLTARELLILGMNNNTSQRCQLPHIRSI